MLFLGTIVLLAVDSQLVLPTDMSETSPGRANQPNAAVSAAAVPQDAASGRQDRRRPPRGPRSQRPGKGGFQGRVSELKGFVYDVLPYKNGKVFTRVTKEIAEYAAREYTGAGEFRQAMQDLQFQPLRRPEWSPINANAPTLPETEDFKLRYKEYCDKATKREENMKKVFALVLGQCTQAMVDRLESMSEFEQVNSDSNVIELLRLIRGCIYEKTTTKHPVKALIDAETALLLCKQEQNQSVAAYYERFKEMAQIFQNNSGPQAHLPRAFVRN